MNTATYKNSPLNYYWTPLHYFVVHQQFTFRLAKPNHCKPLNTRDTETFPQIHSSEQFIRTELLSRPLAPSKNTTSSTTNAAIVRTFQTQPALCATPLTRATSCTNFYPKKSIGGTASPAIYCAAGPDRKSSTGLKIRRKPSAFEKTCASD